MHTRFYNWLLRRVLPGIRLSTKYAKINGRQFEQFASKLIPGDIVLCSDYRKLTSYLIGGQWSHAAIYAGGSSIFEMIGSGFNVIHVYDFCKESDRVCILRCNDFDYQYAIEFTRTASLFQGCDYDREFKLGVEALYCSELVVASDFEKRLDVDYSDFAGIGRPYISPQGLYEAKNCTIIYDSGKQ